MIPQTKKLTRSGCDQKQITYKHTPGKSESYSGLDCLFTKSLPSNRPESNPLL